VQLIRENQVKKGDVLTVAQIAGIQAGKKTSELIPLCHPLAITRIEVLTSLEENGVIVTAEARCTGQTGVEMEALTAVSVALLTIYDMCKAADKGMVIERSGWWKRVRLTSDSSGFRVPDYIDKCKMQNAKYNIFLLILLVSFSPCLHSQVNTGYFMTVGRMNCRAAIMRKPSTNSIRSSVSIKIILKPIFSGHCKVPAWRPDRAEIDFSKTWNSILCLCLPGITADW